MFVNDEVNFINIDGNILNTKDIICIVCSDIMAGGDIKPAVRIKLKDNIIINLVYTSRIEAEDKLESIWKKLCLK